VGERGREAREGGGSRQPTGFFCRSPPSSSLLSNTDPSDVACVSQFTLEVESQEDGFLGAILVKEGEEVETGVPIAVVCDEQSVRAARNPPCHADSLSASRIREWIWWAHTGGGNALSFKQPTSPYDIESGAGGHTLNPILAAVAGRRWHTSATSRRRRRSRRTRRTRRACSCGRRTSRARAWTCERPRGRVLPTQASPSGAVCTSFVPRGHIQVQGAVDGAGGGAV
jgi:hypothetical protein